MLFNSQVFIFLFLPLSLVGWYILNHFKIYKTAQFFLIGMSLWFYGYFNPKYLLIIISSIAINYLISLFMEKSKLTSSKKIGMILGIVFNVFLLGYYKYYDFFIENINFAFNTDFTLKNIILPLGISFFTLQQLSYIIDRSWDTAPHYNICDYMAYVTFFPQLIAGPIVLHSELIPQFQNYEKRHFDVTYFTDGVILFSLGLIKKVLLADTIALFVNNGYSKIALLDTFSAWMVALAYTFELYFDFSGYCDMAVGLGKMFNFDLPNNFDSPYKSHNVTEYWQRWHFTLTRFWNTYIYNPLLLKGMRKKNKKIKNFYKIFTPLVVLFISGVWHGASWTFVIWGICEGIAVVWSQRKKWRLKKGFFSWFFTFLFTVFAAAIFRSEKWDVMIGLLKKMFTPSFNKWILMDISGSLHNCVEFYPWITYFRYYHPGYLPFAGMVVFFIIMIISTFVLIGPNAHGILAHQKEQGFKTSFIIYLCLLTMWALISLTQVSTFLYFNF